MKQFMYQMSSGYSGRLKAKNKRQAKKKLQRLYYRCEILLLVDESVVLEKYNYGKKTYLRLSTSLFL